MGFSSRYKTHYIVGSGVANSGNQLIPSPQLSIDPEYYYANDIPIGYTYNITLDGYVTSIDTRTYSGNEVPGFSGTLLATQRVKNILNGNDGTLVVLDSGNNEILRATGGTIRGLSFSESDNFWVNYSTYSADIEFNEIELANCSGSGVAVACDSLPSGVINSNALELVDMKKYRIKSFSDSWNFELSDTIYSSHEFVRNDYITATYTINATGKHYFKNHNLIPAWEQAKNFVQYRLKNQADRLIDNVLTRPASSDGCANEFSIATVFGSGTNGLLDGLSSSDFNIYNERISCEASEADGSFAATYYCLIKRNSPSGLLSDNDSIHTYSTSTSVSDDSNKKNITISVNGNIQGLVLGGLTQSSGIFSLPASGEILLSATPTASKYTNALTAFNKIGNSQGLNDSFKDVIGVTNAALEADCGVGEYPPTASHSVSHNYTEGSISYRTSYTTERANGQNNTYQNIRITVQESTPVIQEFIVPGREDGPIIQRLNVDNPKRVTVSIDGGQNSQVCCDDANDLLSKGCGDDFVLTNVPSATIAGLKLISDSYSIGKDGSYSVNRSYISCS